MPQRRTAGRPRAEGRETLGTMIFCRVDDTTVARLERYRAGLQEANPGRLTRTSEAVRALLLEGLDRAEGGRRRR